MTWHRVRGGDEPFQLQRLEVVEKELRELAPLRVVTWQENGPTHKDIGAGFKDCLHLIGNMDVRRVELVVLGSPGSMQGGVGHGLLSRFDGRHVEIVDPFVHVVHMW